jgi:hypothetical protein
MNLTEEVKDLYIESYKILKKEIEDTRRWNNVPCLWTGIINILKMAIILKAIYRFNECPSKFQCHSS